MQKRYNVHRATVKHSSNATHNKYRGVIDFCGGAYGILKGAVKRALEMAGCGMESSVEAGANEGTGKELQPEDSDMRRRLQAVEIEERELRAMALELDLMKRRQQLQSQVTIITSCSVSEKN